ncbi:CoxG family protein [Pseudomaricurvus sp. HS19]|uniref:CoxG family protein n=1 Tax=Pseudomaricurvus sp. HS19 TaxID=2692626 RepID=UPI0013679F5D|nr:carbon monoxide dehydrogenase subunit G [Pseudomaricurvus sp. HS19]MYM64059.1 carbon monoxide dehydrogenase [Pseudomaricurvus sp. HS19]
MQMVGEQFVAAPCQRVWEALNDPEILRASIPGCQTLAKEADDRFTATVEVKVGPIGARFKGVVTLSDINAPHGYTLNLEGNGGIAGSMKGAAKVRLEEKNGGTMVIYEVDAEVGGRMAQLGGPIIDATAKQLAGKFFARFGEVVTGVRTAAAPAVAAAAASGVPAPAYAAPAKGGFWMGLAIGLLLVLVAFVAFEYGRSSASSQVIVLDKAQLQQLLHQMHQQHHPEDEEDD